jgi:cobalt/nickel transport system permease protein
MDLIDKSLKEATNFFHNFFATEKIVYRDGFLQKLDARFKIPGMLVLLILPLSTFDPLKLSPMFFLIAFFILSSKIEPKLFLSRVWLFPLFSFIVVLPKAFFFEGWGIGFSESGLIYALIFSMRVFIAVSILSLVILTTPFSEIISTLRFFRVPESFISVLVLTYRYITLTFSEMLRILLARESRRVKRLSFSEVWKNGGNALGVLFIRILERSERVYLSSLSRGGFRHKPYTFPLKFRPIEAFFITFVSGFVWWFIWEVHV